MKAEVTGFKHFPETFSGNCFYWGPRLQYTRLLGRRLLHGREGVELAAENSRSHYIHSREEGSDGSWYSTHFLLYSAWEHSPWMVPPTFRMGFLSSVKPFWKHPYRHPYKCVSMVILNPVETVTVGMGITM